MSKGWSWRWRWSSPPLNVSKLCRVVQGFAAHSCEAVGHQLCHTQSQRRFLQGAPRGETATPLRLRKGTLPSPCRRPWNHVGPTPRSSIVNPTHTTAFTLTFTLKAARGPSKGAPSPGTRLARPHDAHNPEHGHKRQITLHTLQVLQACMGRASRIAIHMHPCGAWPNSTRPENGAQRSTLPCSRFRTHRVHIPRASADRTYGGGAPAPSEAAEGSSSLVVLAAAVARSHCSSPTRSSTAPVWWRYLWCACTMPLTS